MSDEAGAAPFEFVAPLSVCVDVRHANAYLALEPVEALAAELGIEVDWLPFPVTPPREPPPGEGRGARHRRARAAHLAREITVYAAARGLAVEQPYRDVDAAPAALGHQWLRRAAPHAVPGYLATVFEGCWNRTLDVADSSVIGGVLRALGQDAAAFAAYAAAEGPHELARLRARLVAAGVFAVPSLVVQGEVFVGRAHLPMVRWLLTERAGPPPI